MKFQHFFKVHQIWSNLQNILESSSETCMWNLSPFREVNLFHRKMLTVPALWNIMKFQHFFKVHQISSNLQNSFESSSETCMWNLSPFREVIFFHRKMLTVPTLWNIMKFNIFSKFTKFHQTCRTYLNHHQKHACEIWANSEKLTYFIEKCWQCRAFELSWKFQHFSNVHQISSNLQNLLESSSETCMWNLSPFREVNLFHRKMPTVPALEISWNFNIFSKFTKFHQTCRTYFNHHQKHACEIWAHSEKLILFHKKMSDSAGPRNIMKISTFFSNSPKFHQTCRIYWNHHQKHACEIWAN